MQDLLQIYDAIRRPAVQKYWDGSRTGGEIYEGRGKHGDTIVGIREDLQALMSEQWHRDIDDDVMKAKEMLEKVIKRSL